MRKARTIPRMGWLITLPWQQTAGEKAQRGEGGQDFPVKTFDACRKRVGQVKGFFFGGGRGGRYSPHPNLSPVFLSLPLLGREQEQKVACNYILIFAWYLLHYGLCRYRELSGTH